MITAADGRAVLEPVNGAETRRAGKHPVAAVNPHHEWRGRRGGLPEMSAENELAPRSLFDGAPRGCTGRARLGRLHRFAGSAT